ncbi:MAG: thiamine diphosphokinase [FCB group bacterium]|nr:thiamine diphosphokinase [FCB group bacterium]
MTAIPDAVDPVLNKPVVLLANGPFPTHPAPLNILTKAGTLICTDGSADKLVKWGRQPHIVIGDMDSVINKDYDSSVVWVPTPDQSLTDFEKALIWCIDHKIAALTALGIFGSREDHSLANLFLLARYHDQLALEFVTDHTTIVCMCGTQTFDSFAGQTVSLLPVAPTSITTSGLKYALRDSPLKNVSQGVSNVSLGSRFTIASSGKLWVFRSHR